MQHFDTPAAITAVVEIPMGLIQITASDRTDTAVEVTPSNPKKDRDRKLVEQTTVEYAEGVLRVVAPVKNQLGNPGAIDVKIELPAGSKIEAKAASGEFRTDGGLGEVVFEGAQGRIQVADAVGGTFTLAAGDIAVGRLGGSATVSTQKGDIRIDEAVSGTLELSTQAGAISVVAAEGVSAALDAGTGYGRIANALKNTEGTPDLSIRATTSYGNIEARSL